MSDPLAVDRIKVRLYTNIWQLEAENKRLKVANDELIDGLKALIYHLDHEDGHNMPKTEARARSVIARFSAEQQPGSCDPPQGLKIPPDRRGDAVKKGAGDHGCRRL